MFHTICEIVGGKVFRVSVGQAKAHGEVELEGGGSERTRIKLLVASN